jgi:hypothetical protein
MRQIERQHQYVAASIGRVAAHIQKITLSRAACQLMVRQLPPDRSQQAGSLHLPTERDERGGRIDSLAWRICMPVLIDMLGNA